MNLLKLIPFFIISIILYSCVSTKTALKNYNSAEYAEAANKFKKVLKNNDAEGNFLLAESLRKSNQLWKSEKYYEDAIKSGYRNEIAYYYLSLAIKSNGNYDKADSLIDVYLKKSKNKDVFKLMKI